MNEETELPNSFAETLRETIEDGPATQAELSHATRIPQSHLADMKAGRRRCTPEYDLRLGRALGTSPGFWLRLQMASDLRAATRRHGEAIRNEVAPLPAP